MSDEYVPLLFSKIGDTVSEFFKLDAKTFIKAKTAPSGDRKLEGSSEFSVKGDARAGKLTTKFEVQDGLTCETTLNTGAGKKDVGGKINLCHSGLAEKTTVELTADCCKNLDVKVTAKGLLENLKLTLGASLEKKLTFKTQYAQDFFSVESSGEFTQEKQNMEVASVIGVDNFNVGGKVKFDNKSNYPCEYDVGAEYFVDDFTVTFKTEDQLDTLVASYLQTKNKVSFGGEFTYKLANLGTADPASSLALGYAYPLGANTTLKGKLSSLGDFTSSLETKLPEPKLALKVTSAFKSGLSSPSVGLGLTLG